MTAEQLERPGLTSDGWSIKDLLWHVAFWCEEAARALGEIRAGTWDGRSLTAGDVDRMNREAFERSREMDPERVLADWRHGRVRMLEAFGSLAEIPPEAGEWFDESGPEHYAEHETELASWVVLVRAEIPGPGTGRP